MNKGLTVRNLRKAMRGTEVLKNLSFDQPTGSIYGISGDNGAGKSTLLKILASVLIPDGGHVSFCGYRSATRRNGDRSSDTFRRNSPWTTGYVYVKRSNLGCRPRHAVSIRKAIVKSAMADPLISDFVNKPIRECSGGMARRASLVVASSAIRRCSCSTSRSPVPTLEVAP